MNSPIREFETAEERIAACFDCGSVLLWLRARAALTGIKGLVLALDSSDGELCCWAELNGHYEYGTTLNEVIDKFKETLPTPKALRQEANRLIELATEAEYRAAREEEQRTEAKKPQPKVSFHD